MKPRKRGASPPLMKKGKVFGKSQIAVAVMLLALGGAVWLNYEVVPAK